MNLDISFAIADADGLPRLFQRFGDALVLSATLVPAKAYTAAITVYGYPVVVGGRPPLPQLGYDEAPHGVGGAMPGAVMPEERIAVVPERGLRRVEPHIAYAVAPDAYNFKVAQPGFAPDVEKAVDAGSGNGD